MKPYYFLLLAVFALQTLMAQELEPNLKWGKPTDEELKMTTYAPDPEADAVVLYRSTDVSYVYQSDFKVLYRIKCRVKVLQPDGMQVADRSILYREHQTSHARKESVVGLKATAYNLEDGKLVKTQMENQMVNTERLDKELMVLKFSVPQVRVGTVIEYEYRIESDYYFDLHDWYAQGQYPVAYTSYSLSYPEWFHYNIEETGINSMERKKDVGSLSIGGEDVSTNEITFIGRKLPSLKDDDFVWYAEDYGNKVTHELQGIYIPGTMHKNYTATWEDIDKLLLDDEDFGGRLKKSSPFKQEIADSDIPNIQDKRERAAAVFKMLKEKVAWNGDYAFWAKSASKLLKEGTGSNADLNFLLINMLQDAGIDAVPVVLRQRNQGVMPLTHASLKYLTTFIVGIHDTDSTLTFIDGSVDDGYFDILNSSLLVERGRAVRKDAPGDWVNVQAAAYSQKRTVIQTTLNADGVLTGLKIRNLKGEAAASLRQEWRTSKDSVATIVQIQEREGIEISKYQVEGLHDFSPTVKETINFTKQCDATGDRVYVNPLVFPPLKESPFTDIERMLPVEFPFKQTELVDVSIELPEGWQVEELPKPLMLQTDGITVRIMGAVNGNVLTMRYQMKLDRTFYAQTEYSDLKAFFDHLAECCKSMSIISKGQ